MNLTNLRPIVQLVVLVFSFLNNSNALSAGAPAMALTLKSADFTHQGEIPKQYTCDGDNISPSLSWSNVPKNAKSLVLIVDDPDAPDPAAPNDSVAILR